MVSLGHARLAQRVGDVGLCVAESAAARHLQPVGDLGAHGARVLPIDHGAADDLRQLGPHLGAQAGPVLVALGLGEGHPVAVGVAVDDGRQAALRRVDRGQVAQVRGGLRGAKLRRLGIVA